MTDQFEKTAGEISEEKARVYKAMVEMAQRTNEQEKVDIYRLSKFMEILMASYKSEDGQYLLNQKSVDYVAIAEEYAGYDFHILANIIELLVIHRPENIKAIFYFFAPPYSTIIKKFCSPPNHDKEEQCLFNLYCGSAVGIVRALKNYKNYNKYIVEIEEDLMPEIFSRFAEFKEFFVDLSPGALRSFKKALGSAFAGYVPRDLSYLVATLFDAMLFFPSPDSVVSFPEVIRVDAREILLDDGVKAIFLEKLNYWIFKHLIISKICGGVNGSRANKTDPLHQLEAMYCIFFPEDYVEGINKK